MKYRSSYGRNLLQHSKEVAKLWQLWHLKWVLILKWQKELVADIGKVPSIEKDIETPFRNAMG